MFAILDEDNIVMDVVFEIDSETPNPDDANKNKIISGTKTFIDCKKVICNTNQVVGWQYSETTGEFSNISNEEELASQNRKMRNNLLSETDWWASTDLTMTDEQVFYRQSLRDITDNPNWPNLNESDWPIKP